jgi:hypothetical protein
MADLDRQMLGIYLNDHLALATAGAALAGRARGSNPDGALGAFLTALAGDMAGERHALLDVMGRLGVRRDRLKELAGWAGEKGGRLKPNGRLRSYSPMSRVTELDALTLLLGAQRSLWRGIDTALGDDPRLEGVGPAARAQAAERRLAALDDHRDAAVVTALGTGA